MYPGRAGERSAGASGTEGGAVGLAFGAGLLVLDADLCGAALAVHGVVLAVRHVAAHAGIGAGCSLVVHVYASNY